MTSHMRPGEFADEGDIPLSSFVEIFLKDIDGLPNQPPNPVATAPNHVKNEYNGNGYYPDGLHAAGQYPSYPEQHGTKRSLHEMSAQDEKAEVHSKRMERKRQTEKMRRQEMNDRLDELAQVLELVELPEQGPPAAPGEVHDKSKENHRVQLLTRAIRCLKNLRYSYDCRTAEVMKLALKMQRQGMQEASEAAMTSTADAAPATSAQPATDAASTASTWGDASGGPHVPRSFVSTKSGEISELSTADEDCVPMMLMMPIMVPKGKKPLLPQIAPVSADMMGMFSGSISSFTVSQPKPAAQSTIAPPDVNSAPPRLGMHNSAATHASSAPLPLAPAGQPRQDVAKIPRCA